MSVKILLVDNDILITEQLREALEVIGYEVRVARDGLEGLQQNREWHPRIILFDFFLPKIDGARFSRYIREDPEFADVCLIVLSGLPVAQLEQVSRIGAFAVLTKEPMAQLLPKVSSAIESALSANATDRVTTGMNSQTQTPIRIEAFKELVQEQARSRAMFQHLPEGLMELDSLHQIISVNPVCCSLLKQTEANLMGKLFADLFPAEVRGRIHSLLRSMILGERMPAPELIPFENGWYKIRFAPLFNASLFTGAVVIFEDLSDEARKINDLTHQNRQLQHLRQELERRLNAVQIIGKLFSSVQYPYGYAEMLETVLNFVPDLIDAEVSAALIENEDRSHLRICATAELSDENLTHVKKQVTGKHSMLHFNRPDPAVTIQEPKNKITAQTISDPLTSSLFLALQPEEDFHLVVGCFSSKPSAFTPFDDHLLSLLLNLTFQALKNVKQVVESERKKMRAMVESMVDGVLMTDQNDEIVIMNQAARKILRVSRKEDSITKKYFQETLGFYPFRLTRGLIHKAGLQATIKEEIKVFEKTLHSVVAPVYDAEGTQTGTVVVLRDITEQKETEERKSDFLSIISHELRTPLASIGGSLDLVLDSVVGQINEKQRRYLELAKDSCKKLNVVIDDLLDISKFEKGKMEIHMEPISIVKLVEEVAEKFQPPAPEKEIVLKLEKPSQDIHIYADYIRLVQVMNNLLSNAIKFTPVQSEIEIRIFTPKVVSPHVGISVKDTGPGIRTEDLERVFDKFEQVRRSDTRKISGTGLGLAISRSIIEAHKGKIWAESKPGEGAKFIFLLPVEKRASTSVELYAEVSDQPAPELNALVISSDADTTYLLKGILLEKSVHVAVAYTPQEGIDALIQIKPDIVIADLDVDPLPGKQMMQLISQNAENPNTPIIAFSETEWNVHSPHLLFLPKPIEINQFIQALNTALLKIRTIDKRRKILLVDDDESMRLICREALQYQNYTVVEAADGLQALEHLKDQKPDLILMDIMLPGIDGFQLAQIIRSNISTSHIPIIFLTAKGQTEDKVRALKAGGNDYLVKPVDSTELAARIETILERTETELSASPTTKLPGSVAIEKEINQLIIHKQEFALCYLDLDNLKSYNDEYGYAKADTVVKQTGDIIRDTVLEFGSSHDFVGHIAGDDFIFITQPQLADNICLRIIERFDRIIPFFYKPLDRERGYIEAKDRYGVWRKIPILSLSVVCVTNEQQELTDHIQIATLAAEYKRSAKAIAGSTYIRNGKTISISSPPV